MFEPYLRFRRLFALPAVLLLVGTAPRVQAQARDLAPSVEVSPSSADQAQAGDAVTVLIQESEDHFQAGQKELSLGHLDAAREQFDRALALVAESPSGGRRDPRVKEFYEHLVDRISATEVKALDDSDALTEQKSDTASLDDLLTLSNTIDTLTAPPSLKDLVASDLQRTAHDFNIPLNPRVLSYIELFQGRLHDFIEEGMKRGSQYLPMIQDTFRAEGLPLDLAYVPLVESAFKANALSRTKAKGVWQFMVGTATENGLRRDWYVDERANPEKATIAAAKYLRTLNGMFGGDWMLALASYNGGPGRMQRAIKRVGADDFWALASRPKLLPKETREYVPMILAAIIIARNPALYGFEFDAEPAPVVDKLTLPHPVDLRRVAKWAGTTVDEIQTLNPELRRWTTPIRTSDYELNVPAGTANIIREQLSAGPTADVATLRWYTVKRGDTLPAVAKKLHVNRADLADANYLSTSARLTTGERLMVPNDAVGGPAAEPAAARQDASSGRTRASYTVKSGDTLSSIAGTFKTSVSALRTWNPKLSSDDRVNAGDRLTVYKPR